MARVYSQEAKNNDVSFITSRTPQYSDVDLTLAINTNGDVFKKRDVAAVKQAVKNLILTNHFEKPFLPRFGGNIRALLFELAYDDVADDIRENIISNLRVYEPRAEIIDIKVKAQPDYNSLDVTVQFRVINTPEVVTFTTTISRLR